MTSNSKKGSQPSVVLLSPLLISMLSVAQVAAAAQSTEVASPATGGSLVEGAINTSIFAEDTTRQVVATDDELKAQLGKASELVMHCDNYSFDVHTGTHCGTYNDSTEWAQPGTNFQAGINPFDV